jgi:hypothetical protein
MSRKAKKTYRAYVVIKNCKKDFGIGVGVLGQAIMSFKDERGQGFDNPMFHMAVREHCDEWLHEHVTVLLEEKVKGDKWDKDPNATHKKTLRGKKI